MNFTCIHTTDSVFNLSVKRLKVLFLLASLFLLKHSLNAQLTATNPSACPGQATVITASWANVGGITYTIFSSAGTNTVQFGNPNFAVSAPVAGAYNYTIAAQGNSAGGPVSSTVSAQLTVSNPQPLVISDPANFVCYGANATFTAPTGGNSYTVTGPSTNFVSPFNVITMNNVMSPTHNGQYTITSMFSGCLRTGTTNLSVSPNNPLTVNSPSSVCQGGSVQLSAVLNGGVNYVWLDNFNSQVMPAVQNPLLTNLQPSQSGDYEVHVQFTFGPITCPRSAKTSINVVQTGAVSVAASPNTTLCQGSSLNLSALVQDNANAQGFFWNGPAGFSSSVSSPNLSNLLPLHSGEYSVTAIFFNSTSAINCQRSAVITVSIVGTSVPSLTVPANVCEGANVTLSVAAQGALGYSWIGPDNFTSSSQTPTVTNTNLNSSGTYQAYALFGIGSVSCSSNNSANMNVVPVNSISVIPPTPVCQPNSAYFNASAIGASSYTWTGPNSFFQSGISPNAVIYNPPLNASGVYTITAGFGSGALICYNSNTVSLEVKPLLLFSLPAYHDLCYNKDILITGPAGATSYSWTSSSGYASNTKDLKILSVQPEHTGTFTLTVSLDGCITKETTYINVRTPIKFNSVVPEERLVCRKDTIIQQILVSGGSENYAYTWNPAEYLSSPTGSYVTISPLGTIVYNVTIFDIACPNFSISQSFKVSVVEPPEVDLSFNTLEGCQPLQLSVNAHIKRGNAEWIDYTFGGETFRIRGNKDTTFNHTLNTAGINTLAYTSRAMTESNLSCNRHEVLPYTVNVLPKPDASVVWKPELPTVSDEVMFYASAKTAVAEYNWSFAGAYIDSTNSSAIGQSVQRLFETAGTYPLVLIAKTHEGCADTIIRFLYVEEDFNVFIPNTFTPNGDNVNDFFYPVMTGVTIEGYNLELFSKQGNKVYSTNNPMQGWDGTYKGSQAPSDVYVYKITVISSTGKGKKEYTGTVSLIR